ncbi:MAG: type II toxin-antitoxin system RelE/ParE family toxin [Candidatus Obscuribacterales bacterium]|jgi:toxin ParE1/3/4|nr:type II toxin-antitoxin system RelE/ParE family toxin [Candidatus Obscuribacterales bacterium]
MREVRFSPQAAYDLEEIYNQIFEQDHNAADRLLDSIETRCKILSGMPNSGRNRNELLKGLQSATEGSYVIFYLTIKDEIVIVRILHSKRDIEKLFSSKHPPNDI